jgi:AcrR family transcriptional regulator
MHGMSGEERPLRADAERNRRRLLEAATEMFRERGLDVGVGEIAERAGVGRGTLFRNFASKEDLIVAIVVERMSEVAAEGRARLEAEDPADALFGFLEEMAGRQQQVDRSLFEAVADAFMANDEIRAAYAAVIETVGLLLERAQASGAVRPDVSAVDVMMLFKGVCTAAASFSMIDPDISARQLDLMRSALSAPAATRPLRGHTPTAEDLDRAFPSSEPAAERRARSAPA